MNDSTADIEKRIIAACDTIRLVWPVMHQPATASIASKPTPRALYTHEDHDERQDDIGRLDNVVSLRHEVTGLLNSWARVIVEEHDLTHHLPDGWDTVGLAELVKRWSRHMSGHEAGQDMADELQRAAGRCKAIAYPKRRDTMRIGACPNTIGVDGDSMTCGAEVRVNAEHPGDIRCPGCGLEDTLDGWVLRMVGTQGPYTASQLVPLLHKRIGRVVSESAIRQWVRRGIIEPLKDGFVIQTDDAGANLFDLEDVLRRLLRHEERRVVSS